MGNKIWAKNLSLKEPGLENGYFTSINMQNWKKYKKEYLEIFNERPHSISTLTFDLIGLISKLHKENSLFNINKFYSENGFIGIDGWFKINSEGNVLRKPNIYQIKNQKFILVN